MTTKMLTVNLTTGAEALADIPGSITQSYTVGASWVVTSGPVLISIAADGKAYPASIGSDPDTDPGRAVHGYATVAGTKDSTAVINFLGRVTGLTLSAGTPYWLGSAGAVATGPGTGQIAQSVGIALTATDLLLQLGTPYAPS